MICYKLRWEIMGGHTHVDVFVTRNPKGTFQCAGEFVVDNDQWPVFHAMMISGLVPNVPADEREMIFRKVYTNTILSPERMLIIEPVPCGLCKQVHPPHHACVVSVKT